MAKMARNHDALRSGLAGTSRNRDALAVVLVFSATTGCGEILDVDSFRALDGGVKVGVDTGSAVDHEGTLGGPAYVSSECGQCIDAECVEQKTVCLGDPTCEAYLGCLAECEEGVECDVLCQARLVNVSVQASREVQPLLDCVDTRCSGACAWSTTADSGASCGTGFRGAACTNCCCSEARACLDSAGCFRSLSCPSCAVFGTDVDSCLLDCLGEVAADDQDWLATREAFLACKDSAECRGACARSGDDWSCVGEAQWVRGNSTPITLTVGAADFARKGELFANTKVDVCFPGTACETPYLSTMTDERGIADVELAPLSMGLPFSYYYRFPEISDDYYPTIMMPFTPLAQDTWWYEFIPGREQIESMAALSGIVIDPGLGLVGYAVYDCFSTGLTNTVLRVELREPQPQSTNLGVVAGSFADGKTDSVGVIFNAEPRAAIVDLFFDDDAKTYVGSAPIIVRPGEMTVILLLPTPARQ